MGGFRLTVRVGPRVERHAFNDLATALDALERRARELAATADARTVDPKLTRSFKPVQQVIARVELFGPKRLRAGLDVRGDGSAEGYTGRVRRRLVEQLGGESPYDALRRTLAGHGGG